MAAITSLSNTASATYNGNVVQSSAAVTQLQLNPTVTKTVDKSTASIGEILTYTVTIGNPGEVPLTDVLFSDTIPVGSSYVTGSFTANGAPVTPTVTGTTISYSVPTIDANGNYVITFQVMVVGGEI